MVSQGLGRLAEVMVGLVAQLWPVSKGQNGGGTEKDCLDSKSTCTRVCPGRGRLGHSHAQCRMKYAGLYFIQGGFTALNITL
jgi:hypothetical protein